MNTFKKISFVIALLVGSAFAQQGLFRQQVPNSGGGSFELCGASQTVAQCQASPVAITSDQAGSSALTSPVAVSGNNLIQFYAPAGTYQLLVNYPISSMGIQVFPVNVNSDPAGSAALADGYFVVPPGACAVKASASAGGTNSTLVAAGASFTPVIEGNTTAAATQTISCQITVPTRLTSGKGITITNVQLQYGVVTTAFTSTTAPIISTITFPAPGAAETPSTITPVAIPGSLTVVPVIGSANLTAQTAGAFYTEQVVPTPAFQVQTDRQDLLFQQGFVQGGAATSLLDVPGLVVHYQIVQ